MDTPNQRTPLLPKPNQHHPNPDPVNLNEIHIPTGFQAFKKEFLTMFYMGFPVIFSYAIQASIPLVSVYSLGRLGPLELASSALANMFASVTGWSVFEGLATALDTLCSQAFTSSDNPHLVGIYTQRGILVSCCVFIPIGFLWFKAEDLLLLLQIDSELAYNCGIYLKWLLPCVFPFIVFECLKKFLQAQGNMHASTYIMLAVLPVNVAINYILVLNPATSLGFIGAPISISITYWMILILFIGYIQFIDGKKAWGGWSFEAFKGWWTVWKLGLSGIIMICTEWWAFELVSIMASYMGTNILAGHSALMSIGNLFYMTMIGSAIASSNRIGNLLGDAQAAHARLSAVANLAVSLCYAAFNFTTLLTFRKFFSTLFSDDPEVQSIVYSLIPIAAIFQVYDGLANVGSGIIRGQGRQHLGAYINLFAYYCLALPVGAVLAFKLGYGIVGLWWGLSFALLVCAICQLILIYFTNWDAQVAACQERVQEESCNQ